DDDHALRYGLVRAEQLCAGQYAERARARVRLRGGIRLRGTDRRTRRRALHGTDRRLHPALRRPVRAGLEAALCVLDSGVPVDLLRALRALRRQASSRFHRLRRRVRLEDLRRRLDPGGSLLLAHLSLTMNADWMIAQAGQALDAGASERALELLKRALALEPESAFGHA